MYELYLNTDKTMMMREDLRTYEVERFDRLPLSFLKRCDEKIASDYPEQYAELRNDHPEPGMYYARVYQFCACNFSEKDGQPDIDEDFNFILERVSCPVRHICKKTTCKAVLTSNVSERERDIIALFPSMEEEEIAERLFISKATVHNHITRIYSKLGFTGPNAAKLLTGYAYKNKLI